MSRNKNKKVFKKWLNLSEIQKQKTQNFRNLRLSTSKIPNFQKISNFPQTKNFQLPKSEISKNFTMKFLKSSQIPKNLKISPSKSSNFKFPSLLQFQF
jgi:hypothetical protein